MKKSIIAAALVLTTGVVSAFTILPAKRDTTIKSSTPVNKKDIGQADNKKDIGQADNKKDIGQAD